MTTSSLQNENSSYCLFDRKSGALIEELHYPQLLGFLLSISSENQQNWLIWREGNPKWEELTDVVSSYIKKRSSEMEPPPLPSSAAEKILAKLNIVQSNEIEQQETDKRLSKRFTKEIPVFITHKGKVFTSATHDISMVGIRLKEELPFHTNDIVSVLLKIEPHPIEVLAKFIKDKDAVSEPANLDDEKKEEKSKEQKGKAKTKDKVKANTIETTTGDRTRLQLIPNKNIDSLRNFLIRPEL